MADSDAPGALARIANSDSLTLVARLASIGTIPLIIGLMLSDHADIGALKEWRAGADKEIVGIKDGYRETTTWVSSIAAEVHLLGNQMAGIEAAAAEREREESRRRPASNYYPSPALPSRPDEEDKHR